MTAPAGSKDALLASLRSHLQTAIELEHSTLPVYLYAFWSIVLHPDADRAPPAVKAAATAIHDVIMQEMLHMALACNILRAVGGSPAIDRPGFIPGYPCHLPGHSLTKNAFTVNLEKCSLSSIVTFMQIELPAAADAPPQGQDYVTIGQFYEAIVEMLKSPLLAESDFAHGGQMAHYSGEHTRAHDNDPASGDQSVVFYTVHSRQDAVAAVAEIVAEGEGFAGGEREARGSATLAHYYRFQETYFAMGGQCKEQFRDFKRDDFLARYDRAAYADFQAGVLDLVTNPGTQALPKPAAAANAAFNSCYSDMLDHMHETFNGDAPSVSDFAQMFELEGLARKVVAETLPDGRICGPSFQYLPRQQRVAYGS